MKKTRALAISAAMSALSVVVLYLASVMPTGQLGLVAAASIFGIAVVIEAGVRAGILSYICVSILGALIVPNKAAVILYAVFFGYYPVIKALGEKAKSRVVEWIIKLGCLNIATTAIVFGFSKLILDFIALDLGIPLIYIAFNLVFVLFDIGISKVIFAYKERISKKIFKG